jgi:hypothetical protein
MVIYYEDVLIKLANKYARRNITYREAKMLNKIQEWYVFGNGGGDAS